MRVGSMLVAVALLGAAARPALADEATAELSPRYLVDGGAVPLLWLPLLGVIVVDSYVPPRESPLLFSPSEGGAPSRRDREVPGAAITTGAVLVIGAIAFGDDRSRWYHVKGMAESLATSGLITVSAKRVFGRQRPDFDAAANTEEGRRSFPSGHATRTLSALTYAALYLRYHGFDQWRDGSVAWWEVASYVGIGALAVGLCAERVYHHRHHVGDVIVGGLLGAASSTGFFYYQEHRYRKARHRTAAPTESRQVTDPISARDNRGLPAIDGPMLTATGTF